MHEVALPFLLPMQSSRRGAWEGLGAAGTGRGSATRAGGFNGIAHYPVEVSRVYPGVGGAAGAGRGVPTRACGGVRADRRSEERRPNRPARVARMRASVDVSSLKLAAGAVRLGGAFS